MDVRNEILRGVESKYILKLYGILLSCNGLTSFEIGAILGQCPRTITNWIHRFNAFGFDGLNNKQPPGRPSKIDSHLLAQLKNDINRHPEYFGYESSVWDGVLLSDHLENIHGIKMGSRQIQRVLKMLGFNKRKIKR